MSRAPGGYRLILALVPARLRKRYGREMEEMFAAALTEAGHRGRVAVGMVWARGLGDALAAALREPWRNHRQRSLASRPSERRTLMIGFDLHHAARLLARQRFATLLVVSMLALGIAANVAVFSLVNGLFLRPLPFPEPERLAYVNETAPRWNLKVVGVNYPDFHQWRQGARLFDGMALYDTSSLNLSGGAGVERVTAARVTRDFGDVLGIRPVLGRFFSPEEDVPNGPPVVVIGHGLWRERFAGAKDVLGQTLRLDGVPRTVVGVLPPEAIFPADARVWIPAGGDPNQEGRSYGAHAVGRLKPGVTFEEAGQDLMRAHAPIFEARDRERVVTPFVRPLREELVGEFRTAASALFVAVGLLLVVACANVASVMLAHAISRRREMGIRLALGASRARVVRQLLVHNLLLAALGGAAGLVLGRWALRGLLAWVPDQLPAWALFGLDGRVMAFAVGVSAATVVLFGWAPALQAGRGDLRPALSNVAGAAVSSPAGRRTLWLLVGSEFAMAALLLVCGGLLFRAYGQVRRVDPGFRTDDVLTFRIALPQAAYRDEAARRVFWGRLLDELEPLPGVAAAGVITCPPLGCHWGTFFRAEGQPAPGPDDPNPVVLFRYASPAYLRTMGIALRAGRFLDERDGRPGGPLVAVVNETFARTSFPGSGDPVGRRFRRNDDAPWITVVGVTADIKHYGLERPMRPGVYFPLDEQPPDSAAAVLRASVTPTALVAAARSAVRRIDPELPLYEVRTMEDALRRSLTVRAAYSWMLFVFALLAVLLALGGAYGVTSYLVSQRTRELGIRVALGARRGDIVRAVLRGSLGVAAAGVAVGVAGSLVLGRFIASLLFGVVAHDAVILGGAAALLLAAAVLANWLPARRAARVNPILLLRAE